MVTKVNLMLCVFYHNKKNSEASPSPILETLSDELKMVNLGNCDLRVF